MLKKTKVRDLEEKREAALRAICNDDSFTYSSSRLMRLFQSSLNIRALAVPVPSKKGDKTPDVEIVVFNLPMCEINGANNVMHTIGLTRDMPPEQQMEMLLIGDDSWTDKSCMLDGEDFSRPIDSFLGFLAHLVRKHINSATINGLYDLQQPEHIYENIIPDEFKAKWKKWFRYSHVLFIYSTVQNVAKEGEAPDTYLFMCPVFLYEEEVKQIKDYDCTVNDVIRAFASAGYEFPWKLMAEVREPVTEHITKGYTDPIVELQIY